MPSLGADMEAGTLVEWLVKPGDRVKRGDIVAVVETQKGAIEIEIFETGQIEKILVDLNSKVPVGTPLATNLEPNCEVKRRCGAGVCCIDCCGRLRCRRHRRPRWPPHDHAAPSAGRRRRPAAGALQASASVAGSAAARTNAWRRSCHDRGQRPAGAIILPTSSVASAQSAAPAGKEAGGRA